MGLPGSWISPAGAILALLALISVVSVALILLKLFDLAGTLKGQPARLRALSGFTAPGPTLAALPEGRAPADRVLRYALGALDRGMPRALLEQELERRGNQEIAALSRFVPALDLIAVVCPLLGLLGTVLGMIVSFRSLEMAGGAANASILAGGIWQALLTTAAGLIVAIPAATAASLCAARLDRVAGQIEDLVTRLLVIVDAPPEMR